MTEAEEIETLDKVNCSAFGRAKLPFLFSPGELTREKPRFRQYRKKPRGA